MAKSLEFLSLFLVGLTGASMLAFLPVVYQPLVQSVVMGFVLAAIAGGLTLVYAYAMNKRPLFLLTVSLVVAVVIGLGGSVLWLLV